MAAYITDVVEDLMLNTDLLEHPRDPGGPPSDRRRARSSLDLEGKMNGSYDK